MAKLANNKEEYDFYQFLVSFGRDCQDKKCFEEFLELARVSGDISPGTILNEGFVANILKVKQILGLSLKDIRRVYIIIRHLFKSASENGFIVPEIKNFDFYITSDYLHLERVRQRHTINNTYYDEYLGKYPYRDYQIHQINCFFKWASKQESFQGYKFYEIPLKYITRKLIKSYNDELDILLKKGDLKATTVEHYKIALRCWLKFMYANNYLPDLSKELNIVYAPKKTSLRKFTLEDCEFILKAAKDTAPFAVYIAYVLMIATAARSCELARLKIEHVNLEEKEITYYGKGWKARTIPLPDSVLPKLKIYLKTIYKSNTYFFVKKSGKKYTDANLNCQLNAHLKRILEISPQRFTASGVHTFRHVLPTVLVKDGIEPEEIAKIMGIEKLNNLQVYFDVNKAEIRKKFFDTFPLR